MSSPTFHSFIDQPANWSRIRAACIVRGWCFEAGGRPVRGMRLRVGELILDGVVGFPRPDVRQALPEAAADETGFEIRGLLPRGRHVVWLEALSAAGDWVAIFQATPEVVGPRWPVWLGGGSAADLLYFQLPGHAKHAPRPIATERFPSRLSLGRRPQLSVVTPSFQQARYLRETLRSVLGQDLPGLQYVVQDGGSTDGSPDIIREHAARLTGGESAPDGGQAAAIAKGFAQTTGGPDDLMAWINSDDFYQRGALGFVTDYFARHPEVDVVYGHRIVVNESSQEVARWFLPPHDAEILQLNDFVPQETLFWRRRIWDRVGGIDPTLRFAMDWDLLLRFAAAGASIVRVPYFLAAFRVHAAQKSTAQMHSVGQAEINRLRERTFGRPFPPEQLEGHPALQRYLRRSAWIEFLWRRMHLRAP